MKHIRIIAIASSLFALAAAPSAASAALWMDTSGGGIAWTMPAGANDEMHGASGNDVLHGNDFDDKIYGDAGDDRVFGDVGFDKLYGGMGADRLYGGSENDILISDEPDMLVDVLDCGPGAADRAFKHGEDLTINCEAVTIVP